MWNHKKWNSSNGELQGFPIDFCRNGPKSNKLCKHKRVLLYWNLIMDKVDNWPWTWCIGRHQQGSQLLHKKSTFISCPHIWTKGKPAPFQSQEIALFVHDPMPESGWIRTFDHSSLDSILNSLFTSSLRRIAALIFFLLITLTRASGVALSLRWAVQLLTHCRIWILRL